MERGSRVLKIIHLVDHTEAVNPGLRDLEHVPVYAKF